MAHRRRSTNAQRPKREFNALEHAAVSVCSAVYLGRPCACAGGKSVCASMKRAAANAIITYSAYSDATMPGILRELWGAQEYRAKK
jgi:hypothetical protein